MANSQGIASDSHLISQGKSSLSHLCVLLAIPDYPLLLSCSAIQANHG